MLWDVLKCFCVSHLQINLQVFGALQKAERLILRMRFRPFEGMLVPILRMCASSKMRIGHILCVNKCAFCTSSSIIYILCMGISFLIVALLISLRPSVVQSIASGALGKKKEHQPTWSCEQGGLGLHFQILHTYPPKILVYVADIV